MTRYLKLPPQILRLVLLTLGIVGTYLVARAILTPPSFGQYGWYRGAALEELASREPVHAGKKSCDECHSDVLQKLAKGEHKTLSCEACHGISRDHAENPDIKAGFIKSKTTTSQQQVVTPEGETKAVVLEGFTGHHCNRCHEANPSKPAWFKQVVLKEHYTGKCTECHVPHHPTEVP